MTFVVDFASNYTSSKKRGKKNHILALLFFDSNYYCLVTIFYFYLYIYLFFTKIDFLVKI